MVARSGVVFPVSMADILANPVEICFGSFPATSITLAAATSPTAPVKALVTPVATPSEDHVWFEDRWMVASLCDE
jgi:hypothetical protein